MKNLNLIFLLTIVPYWSIAQTNSFSLVEYFPAPGQHINIESAGTPEAALQMITETDKLVSLGSFGGYVILEFENGCQNHPDNPYGIDFNLFGNVFAGASEPGVVWVMKDENQNGLADDAWYQIAGSHYFHSKTKKEYGVTYFTTDTRDVFWKDNSGKSGWIEANSFNLQEYYPQPGFFPDYPQDSVRFTGTLVSPAIDTSDTWDLQIGAFAFGYADNHPRKREVDTALPDNPYTGEVEGAGGDPFDISWAVNSLGNYVDLDSIHFVKIVSGSLLNAGRLGEISTDVTWLSDVEPGTEQNKKNELLVIYEHLSKIVLGDSLLLEARYFEKGRISDEKLSFVSQNETVVEIDTNGLTTAKQEGEALISVSAGSEVKTTAIKVVVPDSVKIETDFSGFYKGDSMQLKASIFDNNSEKLDVPVTFFSSDPKIAEVIQKDEKMWLNARQAGEIALTCSAIGFDLQKSVLVNVLSAEDKINIYFSAESSDENLLPFQWIEVGPSDLNNFVGERNQDYSALNRLTLFHALVSGLTKAEVSFEFRDDEAANGNLYLYSVENDDIFTYGWGGKTDPEAYARGWWVRLNNLQHLNDFSSVEISDGDTVDLYHVSDINSSWNYSRLLADKDSALINEEIELVLEQTACSYSNGGLLESGLMPVENGEIILHDNTFFTGTDGKIEVALETNPPLTFYSAKNAVLIREKVTTFNKISEFRQLKIYPNPVEDILTIDVGGFQEYSLKFTNLNGKVLAKHHAQLGETRVEMGVYSPGIYLLHVTQHDKTEIFKIIKK